MIDLNSLPLAELYEELARAGGVRRLLELARDEDLGAVGDVTTEACALPGRRMSARIVARGSGVVAGLAAAPELLRVFGGGCSLRPAALDGERVGAGAVLGELSGELGAILQVERALLNTLSRLSGVATTAAAFVDAARRSGGTGTARVYDTRKTAPGARALEKYAVRCGGGMCHRIGLFDAVLIKDNHIAHMAPEELGAFVAGASRRARERASARGGLRFVEVEVDSLSQLERILALEAGLVDVVLLDNMSLERLREAVRMRNDAAPAVLLEASGGVTLETVGAIAETGVDRVSAGAITQSAPALDIGLDID